MLFYEVNSRLIKMKILWSVNTIMPRVAEKLNIKSGHAISWIDAMSERLKSRTDLQLAIVVPNKKYKKTKMNVDNITYYLISEHASKDDWNKILEDYRPDVIHAYGTELGHNFELIKSQPDVPIIISLQGILTEYERFYYGGIDVSKYFLNFTIRDLVFGSVFKERRKFQKNAVREQYMLQNVSYVEGRTDWDRVASTNINPKLQYYHCPRLLRNVFYETAPWNIDLMEAHSIFVTQGNYPIKGLHFLLEAVEILRKKYPDIRLYIAGKDTTNPKKIVDKLKRTGYSKMLKKQIQKNQLNENIVFTGTLTAQEVAVRLSRCNVMVIPSVIENAPNALAEAEVLGVPCVASYVGGNPEMLKDGEEGFLYCYNEPGLLADKISKIFDDASLAMKFSENSRETALKRHNPEFLESTIIEIYQNVINDFEK